VNHTFWYVARAAGFTAYGLLTLAVCFGLLVRTKLMDALVARWQAFDVHQVTALAALAFVGLHIFALLGDQYVGFQLSQLFIPFTAPYRPTEVALGVIALYLMIVVVGSFYVRRSIGYEAWRAIHYMTFGVFLLALGHGVLAGTDTGATWARAIYWATGLLVGGLTYWRINREANRSHPESGDPAVASPPRATSRAR
jgi:predicted ferric reductase